MARELILVNLQRCTGCWSCSIGCKMVNELADDVFRIRVETEGSGAGIDRPAGVWPELSMGWKPVWTDKCTDCAEGNTDHGRFCIYTCPSRALTCGAQAEAELERLTGDGFEAFDAEGDGLRSNVKYIRPIAEMPPPGKWDRYEVIEAVYDPEFGEFKPTLEETVISEFAEHPATAALLQKHLGWLDLSSPEGAMSAGMTLPMLAPFSQGLLDDDALAAFRTDLDALAASGKGYDDPDAIPKEPESSGGASFSVKSKIGDIAGDPSAWAILAKYMPGFEIGSKEFDQAKGLSVKMMARFAKDMLPPDKLDALDAELQALGGASDEGSSRKKGFFRKLFGR